MLLAPTKCVFFLPLLVMWRFSLISTCYFLLKYFDKIRISAFVGPKFSLIITGLISVFWYLIGILGTSIFFMAENGWFTGQLVLKVMSWMSFELSRGLKLNFPTHGIGVVSILIKFPRRPAAFVGQPCLIGGWICLETSPFYSTKVGV